MSDKNVLELAQDGSLVTEKFLDMQDGTHARRGITFDALTAAFFQNRQFRTFFEFNIATGTQQVFKVVVPSGKNMILFGLDLDLVTGAVRITSAFGGTEGGSFSTSLPILSRNGMSDRPTYTPTLVITTGGTLSGQTTLDAARHQVSSQGNQPAAGIIGNGNDFRGLGPGTYYLVFAASGADSAVGVMRMRWIER